MVTSHFLGSDQDSLSTLVSPGQHWLCMVWQIAVGGEHAKQKMGMHHDHIQTFGHFGRFLARSWPLVVALGSFWPFLASFCPHLLLLANFGQLWLLPVFLSHFCLLVSILPTFTDAWLVLIPAAF